MNSHVWLSGEQILPRVDWCAFWSFKEGLDLVCVAPPEGTEELYGSKFCFCLWKHFQSMETHNRGCNYPKASLAASPLKRALLPINEEVSPDWRDWWGH